MVATALIREALRALGKQRFALGIHDACFPGRDDEDLGRGSPYSRGAEALFEFVAQLGFDGVQLGPQGVTHRGSPSPYEGTLFSRSPLSLPLSSLADRGLLSAKSRDALLATRPPGALERMPYRFVYEAYEQIIAEASARADGPTWDRARAYSQRHAGWLEPDAVYDALCDEHRRAYFLDWHHSSTQGAFDARLFAPDGGEAAQAAARWEALRSTYRAHIDRHALTQLLLDEEHAALRGRLRALGLSLYGDLQVGLSAQDAWRYRALFVPGYRMGAPPSRTNPAGQPWGYVALHPLLYGTKREPGPVRAFVTARAERTLDAFEGVRIDHPHGWIDPWVYRDDDASPFHAVEVGARLFSSPDLGDHPALAAWSIARASQIDASLPRHADDFVRSLSPAQVEQYSTLVDLIVEAATARGLERGAVVCEVLSTLPHPVRRVLERHGLGRFRVTQKANLSDPTDVYRSENAQPADWVMLGNHDTAPIWRVVEGWFARGEEQARASYLAARLVRSAGDRERFAQALCAQPPLLVQAQLADALASAAQNVFVFFADLFGMRDLYNAPGTINDENWTLRAPHDFAATYARRAAAFEALDIPWALALALRARGGEQNEALATQLLAGSPATSLGP